MSAIVWGTFCNLPQQFGLSFYCKGSPACDVFSNFTAVQCVSQQSQLYCTNQQSCSGANYTDDIYITFPSDGGSTSGYDIITRQTFTYNQTFSIPPLKTSQAARREVDAADDVHQLEKRAAAPSDQIVKSFKEAYSSPNSASKLLINALCSTLFIQGSKNGAFSAAALQKNVRDTLFSAVQSTASGAIAQLSKCNEVNATRNGMVGFSNKFIGDLAKGASPNSFATWVLTMFVGHTIGNSAFVSEIDIAKKTIGSSLSSCTPVLPSAAVAAAAVDTATSSTTTSAPAKASAKASAKPPPSKGPPAKTCDTRFVLDGVSEAGFNAPGKSFSTSLACANLDVSSIGVLANDVIITSYTATPKGIVFSGFSDSQVFLTIFARDNDGSSIINSFQLFFGRISLPVTVYTAEGQPAPNVNVQATATLFSGVTQNGVTDSNGQVRFVNLIDTTIGLVARSSDGQLAATGVASSGPPVRMTLIPFGVPGSNNNLDFSHGLEGWSGGSLSGHTEKREDHDLILATGGSTSVVTTGNTFDTYPFTSKIYVRYRFQTDEIPGGFYGTQYNDYYSVSIRSNTSEYVSVTNSMNALGRGAFTSNGYTDWFTLQLTVPKGVAKSVRIDVAVANVADGFFDSKVIVDKAGDIDCDNCNDCASCPNNPMCQQVCIDPPPQSCAFYANCAEASIPCKGKTDTYSIEYGENYCTLFQQNFSKFSAGGQSFVYSSGQCLQKALVPAVACGATCTSVKAAAFNSYSKCYVDNGFCDLKCADVAQVSQTALGNLESTPGFKQAWSTGPRCPSKPADFFSAGKCGTKLSQNMLDVVAGVYKSLNGAL